jgi:HEPN domain-containing protein
MNEKDEYVLLWIKKGDHDLGTANLTFKHIPEYRDIIAFHCQQAVEKYLKAWLVFLDCEVPHTHDLPYLLDVISRFIDLKPELFTKALTLSGFSVEVRYPDSEADLSDLNIKEAMSTVQLFRTTVLHHLGLTGKMEDIPH